METLPDSMGARECTRTIYLFGGLQQSGLSLQQQHFLPSLVRPLTSHCSILSVLCTMLMLMLVAVKAMVMVLVAARRQLVL